MTRARHHLIAVCILAALPLHPALAQSGLDRPPPGSAAFDPRNPPTTTTVRLGETLFSVAERTRTPVSGLIEANGLRPPYALRAGQVLNLPALKVHVVQRGEGISQVAERYSIDPRSLRVFNRLPRNPTLHPGQRIILPPLVRDRYSGLEPQDLVDLLALEIEAGRPVPQAPRVPPTRTPPRPAPPPLPGPVLPPPPIAPPTTTLPRRVEMPARPADRRFNWPVRGRIVETFGPKPGFRQIDGVEIEAPLNAPFGAAADGEVVYAGNELEGYGWLVLVRHPGGYITAYAYASELIVRVGDRVREGQTLGAVGQTGRATSPRLHFQVRSDGAPVNPVGQLPRMPV
jgi:murein DD-endopeptidase MepM/ murein hydrolase activator NlpD